MYRNFLNRLLARKPKTADWRRPREEECGDLPEDQIRFIHEHGDCPYCRAGYGLYRGPRGAASINLFCGNPECDSCFSVIDPEIGFVPIGQFMGRCPPEFIEKMRREIRNAN